MASSAARSGEGRDAGTPARPAGPAQVALGGAATAVAAALATLVVYGAVRAAGVELQIPEAPGSAELGPLGALTVVIATVVPVLLGAAVYGVLRRRVERERLVWRVLALGFGVLSLGGVLGLDAGAANAAGLTVLHLTVAAVAAFFLPPAVDRAAGAVGAR